MQATLTGTYGSQKTPCTIFLYNGWYCVEDSRNVNRTHEQLKDGVNVEEVSDYDTFTAPAKIQSLDELIEAVNS
jgi:hypothetical protein